MSLADAKFRSPDGDGRVLYDTVTMYVYPVVFEDKREVREFLAWYDANHKEPYNGMTAPRHYRVYEQWVQAGRPRP